MNKNCIVVFLKYPREGEVKTRIAAGFGDDFAAGLYRVFVSDTISMTENIPADKIFYYAQGSHSAEDMQGWLGGNYRFIVQFGSDLGERMKNALADQFRAGYEKALIIGTDIPELGPAVVNGAFDALGRNDVVIGPSKDGGYYLIGFGKDSFVEDAFAGIDWSTHTVFKETVSILRKNHCSIHRLKKYRDIDLPSDVEYLYKKFLRSGLPGHYTSEFFLKSGNRSLKRRIK